LSIKIYYDNVKYRLGKTEKVIETINEVIKSEKKLNGDLNFIFTDDKKIKSMNIEFLKHNFITDVIAFDYKEGHIIEGEIYIGIEQVKRNTINYKVSLKEEVLRVMIHGTLHLCGYEDKTDNEKLFMRLKEEYWMERFKRK
jgi:probable rRNA maturation factor